MLRAGRTPRELAEGLGVSEQTLRNWRRQDQVDRHESEEILADDLPERTEQARLAHERADAIAAVERVACARQRNSPSSRRVCLSSARLLTGPAEP